MCRAVAVLLCQGGRYFLADAGQMRCPSGSAAVAKDACFRAAKEAGAAVGRGLRVTAADPFSKSTLIAETNHEETDWDRAPSGCFVHEYSVVPDPKIMLSIAPLWGTNGANPDNDWQLVCEGMNAPFASFFRTSACVQFFLFVCVIIYFSFGLFAYCHWRMLACQTRS